MGASASGAGHGSGSGSGAIAGWAIAEVPIGTPPGKTVVASTLGPVPGAWRRFLRSARRRVGARRSLPPRGMAAWAGPAGLG